MLPLAETLLFGNQPFIADLTAAAVRSAMKGWLPNSSVSARGSTRAANSAAPTPQPAPAPGAAAQVFWFVVACVFELCLLFMCQWFLLFLFS